MTWNEYKYWFFRTYGEQQHLGGGLGNGCGPVLVCVLVCIIIIESVLMSCNGCSRADVIRDTIRTERIDTFFVVRHDTVPVIKSERVVSAVILTADGRLVGQDEWEMAKNDGTSGQDDRISGQDGIKMTDAKNANSPSEIVRTFDVVQREYSDDSTYTAYVSGLEYGEWPRLDSITVRQCEVRRVVTETITVKRKEPRWSVGLQAGYGYGLAHNGFEPYVGIGVTYRIFPP